MSQHKDTRGALTACKRCGGSRVVDDGEITGTGGVEFSNGPIACVKDCPDCAAPSLPAGDGLTDRRVDDALHYLRMGMENLVLDNGVHMVDFRNAERILAAPRQPGEMDYANADASHAKAYWAGVNDARHRAARPSPAALTDEQIAAGHRLHRLRRGDYTGPSQLCDAFTAGVRYAESIRAAQQAQPAQDERGAFESFAESKGWFTGRSDGEYEGWATEWAWTAWQARAAQQVQADRVMRWNPLPGGGMNPHPSGMYVRFEDLAQVQADAKPERIVWSVTGSVLRVLAAELIRAAESMGEDDDEMLLEVRRPGTVEADDRTLNSTHILAVSLADEPDEGVYPINPEDPTEGREDQVQADAGAVPFGYAQPSGGNYFTRTKRIADRIGGLVPVYAHPSPAGESDKRDAERYRWLRDKSEPGICAFYLSVGQAFHKVKFKRETVDQAIDAQIAAMSREQSQEKGGERG